MWNVYGLSKAKLNDPTFVSVFNSYDFVVLSETWTRTEDIINIPDFQPFTAHRLERSSNSSKQARGGVIIYVKEKLLDGVSVIKTSSDLIWLKLDRDFFGFKNDIILCGFYVLPCNSSARANFDIDVIDKMIMELSELKILHPNAMFVLGGDGNGRVSNLSDHIVNDLSSYLPLPNEYIEDSPPTFDRINEDSVVTSQGRRIMDFCKMSNLRIVNGRANYGPEGARYTCVTNRGCSTVDLTLCSAELLLDIKSFCILDSNIYSDHRPMAFYIESKVPENPSETKSNTEKMSWKQDKKDEFVQNLNDQNDISMLDEMVE